MPDGYVPDDVKRRLYDAAVQAAERSAEHRWPRVARFLAWFRSDADSRQRFDAAVERAFEVFVHTLKQRNPLLANEVLQSTTLWRSKDLQEAVHTILASPGTQRPSEWNALRQAFTDHITQLASDPGLLEDVLQLLISCLAAEVSLLPEFRELYRFEFERRAAQSTIQLASHWAGVSDFLRLGQAVPPVASLPAAHAPLRLIESRNGPRLPTQSVISSGRQGVWALDTVAESPATIVVVGPDTRRTALLPTDSTPDYSYLEFFGDKDTMLESSVFLARAYPAATITRYPASWMPAPLRAMPLVLVGGPSDEDGVGGNRIARQVMEYCKLPIAYHDDCEGVDYDGCSYRTEFASDGRLSKDWGIVMRVRNPWNTSNRALLIQGVHTHGVLGAFRAISDPSVADHRLAILGKVGGDDPLFSALIRVNVLDGVVTSAALDEALVRICAD